jgi:cytosine/adenosine deaminase-related metal-dependent hydrolase
MCKLCDEGKPQDHTNSNADSDTDSRLASRRDFLKATTALGAGAGLGLFAADPAAGRDDDDRGRDRDRDHDDDGPPRHTGRPGRRYIIRGGAVMTMDPNMPNKGEFPRADVLVVGKKIRAVRPNIHASDAAVIDARGKIVMPGLIDTHHHQFETATRGVLADSLLFDGLDPAITFNYFQKELLGFAPVYRPKDVYISELFGGLAQLDAGVTTVHDVSQIHHSPQHSDAAIQALFDTGRRAAFGYFESAGAAFIGTNPGNQYPQDAVRIKKQWFSSSDQLVTMIMGGEIYLPAYEKAWEIGRALGIPIAAHIVGTFGMAPTFDLIAQGKGGDSGTLGFGPDNLFIHVTGMSDLAWQAMKDAGATVSLAVPIEMNMRHGTPPVLKTMELGFQPSLSTDVEVVLTADMFTQMRTAMALQRMLMNARGLGESYAAGFPELPLLTTRDVLRWATINGARDLRLDSKVGTLTPGKEADIIILDPNGINVTPLNYVPGAVVQLMERNNVETVIVAGKVRKWKGKLLDVDLRSLRRQLERSRDYLFRAAGIPQDLFRAP